MRFACRSSIAAMFALGLAGCGGTTTKTVTKDVTIPQPSVTYIPPLSSVTPEGARPLPPPKLGLTLTNSQLVTPAVLTLLEEEEGYRRCAYWDPFGRIYTVGYGQTHLFGHGVPGNFCFASHTAAVNNLKYAVEHEGYLSAVVAVVGRNEAPGVYVGEISFVYNLGAGIFTGQLRADLQRHNYVGACAIQRGYVHAGGVVLSDLVRRRGRECDHILNPGSRPKPLTKAQLITRRRVLRRVLLRYGCDARRKHHQKLGPTCTRWFAEGARVNRELAR